MIKTNLDSHLNTCSSIYIMYQNYNNSQKPNANHLINKPIYFILYTCLS